MKNIDPRASGIAADASSSHVTFTLGGEMFALQIEAIREVLDWTPVTRVPRMPAFLLGLINLRGTVIPVADLRLKLGMSRPEKTVDTCIIVAEIAVGGEPMSIGLLADRVNEVVAIDPAAFRPSSAIRGVGDSRFVKGIARLSDETFVILPDMERIFSDKEEPTARSPEKGDGAPGDPGGKRTE